ncbi:unnamed protein product [Dicrocoelium dendriticum]|nr:unnamed protein product [Dicrocoelium dendriticum]
MPRPTSAQSEQDDGADLLLQEEYDRLMHQVRLVENEQHKTATETNVKLRRYHKVVEHLSKENEELTVLLTLAHSDQNKKKDVKATDELKHQLEQQEVVSQKIENTKRYHQLLDAEIRKYEKLLRAKQQQRPNQSKVEDTREVTSLIENKTLSMERNLHTKTVKFCETMTENAHLKSDIEKLRNERGIYLALWKKLNEKLNQLKKVKRKVMQNATEAYEFREDAVSKRLALQDKNDKDKAAHEVEMRDLLRIADHKAQLQKFMTIKANERNQWKREAEERKSRYGKFCYIITCILKPRFAGSYDRCYKLALQSATN